MEVSGAEGKIRLSRASSSRSNSALEKERPEMVEVSIPNVKPEKTEMGLDLEEIKDKDQQLFNLISEGYEILNIKVPSKLPTLDEEESTKLEDNLSYLNQTPRIKSRNPGAQGQNDGLPGEVEVEILEKQEFIHTLTQEDSACDMDYFDNFTLLRQVVLGEQAPEPTEEVEQPAAKPQAEELKHGKERTTDSHLASEYSFVTDVEISEEYLDDVFYGNRVHGAPAHALDLELGGGKRMKRESQRSLTGSCSVFTSEETTLTPIFLSPGPPKIIDQILLDEPTAMSFMYSDLYQDAMGESRLSDEEYSEAESMAQIRDSSN